MIIEDSQQYQQTSVDPLDQPGLFKSAIYSGESYFASFRVGVSRALLVEVPGFANTKTANERRNAQSKALNIGNPESSAAG